MVFATVIFRRFKKWLWFNKRIDLVEVNRQATITP
jgi:hypothetical protein